MKRKFQQNKVVEHFETSAEVYSSRKGVFDITDKYLINFFKEEKTDPDNILEVGGGSGYLLEQLGFEAKKAQLVNCEIAWKAYQQQVNPHISLTGGNALNLPYKSNTFDYIISKNLFHHIVGTTRKTSKEFAKKAALEMNRVLKKNGCLMIIEEYHEYSFFAGLIFYISLLFSLGKFSWEYFDIRPKVIVSFLTPQEIRDLFFHQDTIQDKTELEFFYPINFKGLVMRMFPFVFKLGFLVHIRRIEKAT